MSTVDYCDCSDLAACVRSPFMTALWLYTSPQSSSLSSGPRYWFVARSYFTNPLHYGIPTWLCHIVTKSNLKNFDLLALHCINTKFTFISTLNEVKFQPLQKKCSILPGLYFLIIPHRFLSSGSAKPLGTMSSMSLMSAWPFTDSASPVTGLAVTGWSASSGNSNLPCKSRGTSSVARPVLRDWVEVPKAPKLA